jgi:23S rRNA pseudouridine1911/1915/1917 synthase
MQKIESLYEDESLIVCYKPAGVATQTRRLGQPDMESMLKNHVALAERQAGRGGVPFIGVVHRLDQPVEGVMVFAKTPQAAAQLSAQVQKRSFGKKYYALVQLPEGQTDFCAAAGLPENGSLCDEMVSDPRANISKIVPKNTSGAKRAKLDYRVLAEKDGCALLDIMLHTGRHHQIRVQLAYRNIPIIGDTKYGKNEPGQLCLCSYHIAFSHPKDGHRMEFTITPHNERIRIFWDDGNRVKP